jgi:DNA-binding NtrC family response regulator
VLSDIVMPGELNGLALARWLREHRPGLPVLLATGYSREISAAVDEGFVVLQKPVTPDLLLATVRELLAPAATSRTA